MTGEFKYIEKYITDEEGHINLKGVDVGCGTNRLSMEVLAIDQNHDRRYAHADVVHDCGNLEVAPTQFSGKHYSFEDGDLDFIFSSHCLEDFDNIDIVFMNWWKKIRVDGLMILILPDMEECNCEICNSEQQVEFRKAKGMSARYHTLDDHAKSGTGNPSHKTNVGKKFMTDLLQKFKEKNELDYEMIQEDTIPHNESCSVDFVIKKIK